MKNFKLTRQPEYDIVKDKRNLKTYQAVINFAYLFLKESGREEDAEFFYNTAGEIADDWQETIEYREEDLLKKQQQNS